MGHIQNIRVDKVCRGFWSQARGLMFSPRRRLLFVFPSERNICLHNWFVFYPIQLIFLDSGKRVIEIKENFAPFTLYRSTLKACYLIENPYPMEIKVGDVFHIHEDHH